MDGECIYMDEICIWIDKCLTWVDRCGPPRLPFAGRAGSGYYNPPAPHVEISYLVESGVENLRLGTREVRIPAGHVALHNVHLGAYTPTMVPLHAWAVFMDVRGERAFADLGHTPLFCSAPVSRRAEAEAAFERVAGRALRFATGPMHYLVPEPLYDPEADASATGRILMKTALLELLALLLEETRAPAEPVRTRLPRPVQRAVEFMTLHYQDPDLALPAVATAARLSVDHFGRLFRQVLGHTPMQHLKDVRVRQAQYLLAHTDLLVEEVAREVGFRDPFHFSRVFRSLTGTSPQQCRS